MLWWTEMFPIVSHNRPFFSWISRTIQCASVLHYLQWFCLMICQFYHLSSKVNEVESISFRLFFFTRQLYVLKQQRIVEKEILLWKCLRLSALCVVVLKLHSQIYFLWPQINLATTDKYMHTHTYNLLLFP